MQVLQVLIVLGAVIFGLFIVWLARTPYRRADEQKIVKTFVEGPQDGLLLIHAGFKPSMVYRLMSEWNRRGWIERCPPPDYEEFDENQRRAWFRLTKEGRQALVYSKRR